MKGLPSVTIILCNYNGDKYLEVCLKSLIETKYKNLKVLFIDDGSTDRSIKIYKDFVGKDSRFKLLINKVNIGLTKSRNIGIRCTKSDVLIFLDNDTQVDKLWVDELVATLYSASDIGGAQSKLIDFQKRNRLQHVGIKLIPYTAWGAPIAQGDKINKKIKTESIIGLGAALAIKREVVQRIKGFDEKLVHYTDDLDFSWRVWIAGYKIVSCPKSEVYHWSKEESSKRIKEGKRSTIYYHLCKNSLRSITKNFELQNLVKYLSTSIFINTVRGFLVLIRRGDISALAGTIRGVWWYLLNIEDTILERKNVQKTRLFGDHEIIKSAMVSDSILDIYRKYFRQTNLLNI